MKKLIIISSLTTISIIAFCQVDTGAIHNAVNTISPEIANKYWPLAAKIFGIATSLWVVISEVMPFLPIKANGIFHAIGLIFTKKQVSQ
jgi:hypothetical protein